MIEEQVEATRDRHRRAQGELSELESKINQAQMNLKQIQTEARAASERTQDDRIRLTEQENRAS